MKPAVICLSILYAVFGFYGAQEMGKGIIISIIGPLFFAPIFGFAMYYLAFIIWFVLSNTFKEVKTEAVKSGVPVPFAIIIGCIAVYLMSLAM